MIRNIKNEFMLILEEVEWMDDETRNDAKKKAQIMEEHIGFPEYILNSTLLDKDYEHVSSIPVSDALSPINSLSLSPLQLTFNNSTYFENVVGYLKNSTRKTQAKLYSVDDRTK